VPRSPLYFVLQYEPFSTQNDLQKAQPIAPKRNPLRRNPLRQTQPIAF
jgi:hypothetical protein